MSAPLPESVRPCPCGRKGRGRPLAFADCCGRFLADPQTPAEARAARVPDAETLMRSRYTAYGLGDEAWLLATWHPRTRPASLQLADSTPVQWLGLDVRAHLPLGADRAEVEFVARSRDGTGRASRLHERSRFVREDGRWYYVDGDLR
ncbi:YchJ family metal-binding protein [uncultured Pseudacidovorax sp.]|uniref:YchJ family protein n=1 Tax=uncultured Pseudacidovorax sp. TaxID=679313 RepID=UPI0025CDDD6A|nr:YchJ family metal-binding protein [uncultured Pseudacidovorax sp.]